MPVLVARDPQQLKGGASLQAVYGLRSEHPP